MIYYDFFLGIYFKFLTDRNCVDVVPTDDKFVILVWKVFIAIGGSLKLVVLNKNVWWYLFQMIYKWYVCEFGGDCLK